MEEKYDIVIIGSGLGGLESAYILSKEGYKVCVLEKNQQFGGCLQTFKSDGAIFDTGVHYVGGLDKGQSLYQYFRYFNILDKLNYKRMDDNGFEHISFNGDNKVYKYGLGLDNFVKILSEDFPDEAEAIAAFGQKLFDIGRHFPFYHLTDPDYTETLSFDFVDISVVQYIDKHFKDEKLKKVLSATNLLYGGNENNATLYEHALIVHAYVESSYRFVDGAGQIANALVRNIRNLGGKVKRYQKVSSIKVEENVAKYVKLDNGKRYYADRFISNVHPTVTLGMLDGAVIRKSYTNRLHSIKNSTSAFALHLVLKENTVAYQNYNVYHYISDNVWDGESYNQENWPLNYMAFTPISSKSDQWADSVIIIAYMNFEEVEKWKDSENIVGFEEDRGADYEAFKKQKSQVLLEAVYKRMPELKGNVVSHCASTPLTYRDYLHSPNGSVYGFAKDFNNPLRSYLSPQSKVSNLFFTGQNINMHGVLGVTVSAFMTCGEIVGKKHLYDQVKIG